MSKQAKRKITVELPKSKDLSNRPSVFERLGTKKSSSAKKTTEHCRQWVQHGSCAYGKSCKFAATHILISPSKQRAANKDGDQKKSVKDDGKSRLHSTVVVRSGRSPDGEIDNWDQNDLEYADTDVLEKRRLQLQRELELQLKMDTTTTKDMRKDKKKAVSSSSSSRSSSSSSASSSSSDGSSSSSSSGREARKKGKKGKLKRNSSSSSDGVPSKKKFVKGDTLKSDPKKAMVKRDDKTLKKNDTKKKPLTKTTIGKKSLSPGKKSGGTPPITSKNVVKNATKHGKSPPRKDKNRSVSPHSTKERDKDKDRVKEREKDKDKDKDREKDKDRNRGRSRSPRKARSRSPKRTASNSKDPRKKGSSERSRPVSPKKPIRKDGSSGPKKRSNSRDRDRTRDKDRSSEKRKDKHDDKDRHDRKDRPERGRERNKETKREEPKRRGRERGLGRGGGANKGLEKPNKPMERLLPRPEERLAALKAISNRALETDKNSTNSKDRQGNSERGGRKQDRERDRSIKRDRMTSIDREPGDYDIERPYEHGRTLDHYERADDRYDDGPRDDDRSPGYGIPGRERHYDSNYEMPGPARGYPENDDRLYGDHIGDHRGYEDRRHRDHSWEGRSGSMERERGYLHPHKEWDNEDYRAGGDWGRERHWPMHDAQMTEWGDKDPEMEGWHHRGHPSGPHRGRAHGKDFGRGMRVDPSRADVNKRRLARAEPEPAASETPPAAAPPAVPAAAAAAAVPSATPTDAEAEDAVPDDLSEISDDPDDILNQDDMVDHNADDDSQSAQPLDDTAVDGSENQSTQDTSAGIEEKESQMSKDDDENTNLDFEEISDGELEEERTRAGLGDALGVDWASLVADVRRRSQPAASGGARDRWRPERVLARLGLSVHLAGADTVRHILAASQQPQQNGTHEQGKHEEDEGQDTTAPAVDVHPVAAIQVAVEKRKRQRAVLFGAGCDVSRALCARRDLALRRHLCRLPAVDRAPLSRPAPQPDLFHAARALLMQSSASG